MRDQALAYYNAAVEDLELAKKLIESVGSRFPSYRVPMKPLNEAIKKAKAGVERKEKRIERGNA